MKTLYKGTIMIHYLLFFLIFGCASSSAMENDIEKARLLFKSSTIAAITNMVGLQKLDDQDKKVLSSPSENNIYSIHAATSKLASFTYDLLVQQKLDNNVPKGLFISMFITLQFEGILKAHKFSKEPIISLETGEIIGFKQDFSDYSKNLVINNVTSGEQHG